MVQTRFKGVIIGLVLQSGNLATSGNVKGVRWRERPDRVTPETVANTTLPVGWFQGHRWSDVEIRILGEATEILGSGTALVSSTGDNLVMTSANVVFKNHLGSDMIVFFTSPIVDSIDSGIEDEQSTETLIKLKAYAVSLPKLT